MPFDPMSDAPSVAPSYWEQTAAPLEASPAFEGHHQTPVLVIGAGFTGLSTALHLAEMGIRSIVLDANQPGWGASGRNNGQVVAALKHEPFEIEETYGTERGRRLIEAVGKGPDTVFDLIQRYGIQCTAKRNGIVTVAHSEKAFRDLKRRTEVWQARKAPLRIMGQAETSQSVGTNAYVGASFDPRGGSINPLAYARGLARAARSLGVMVYRDAEVLQLRRHLDNWQAVLRNGTVAADRVIIGTNAYTTDFWPGLKRTFLPIRTPQLVSKPLRTMPQWPLLTAGAVMSDTRKLIVVKRHEELTPLPTSGIDPLHWLDVSLGSSAAPAFCRRPERRFSRSR
jgi:glycine/D-amino acid oxidase-like deaminating enzyme